MRSKETCFHIGGLRVKLLKETGFHIGGLRVKLFHTMRELEDFPDGDCSSWAHGDVAT